VVIQAIHESPYITDLANLFLEYFRENPWLPDINDSVRYAFHTLEAMVGMGWITASVDPKRPGLRFDSPEQTSCIFDEEPGSILTAVG
jgi:hypothetical protein